jgi:hypothetical protein
MIPEPALGGQPPLKEQNVSGSWIGLGNQEAAQKNAQAQTQEDA